MARGRSPSYPNFSLEQALKRVEAAYEADRMNALDRESLAQHIGYSGLSGAADKAIATLQQYGLVEKVSKGEVRVTRLAVDCLYPDPNSSNAESLREAAFSPELFAHLIARFEAVPSETTLRSYLKREGFLERAINPAVSAYLDTCSYLKQNNAYESAGATEKTEENEASADTSERQDMKPQNHNQFQTPPAPSVSDDAGPQYTFASGQIRLAGSIKTRQQAEELERIIAALKPMLRNDESEQSD